MSSDKREPANNSGGPRPPVPAEPARQDPRAPAPPTLPTLPTLHDPPALHDPTPRPDLLPAEFPIRSEGRSEARQEIRPDLRVDPRPERTEYRSGPYLSEAGSALIQLPPVPPPQRRTLGLRARLMLWILGAGLLPLICALCLDLHQQRLAADREAEHMLHLLRQLLIPVPPRSCSALTVEMHGRLRQLHQLTGLHAALYTGERLVAASDPGLLPHLEGDLALHVLEMGLGPPLHRLIQAQPTSASDPRQLLAALTRVPESVAGGCSRLILLTAVPAPPVLPPLHGLVFGGLVLLLIPLCWLVPARIARPLARLQDRVQFLASLVYQQGDPRTGSVTLPVTTSGPGAAPISAPAPPDASPSGITQGAGHGPGQPGPIQVQIQIQDLPRLLPLDHPLLRRGDELGDLSRAFAQMTEAMRDKEARLGARVRELTTLSSIGRAISSVLDLEEALRKIVSEVVAVFSARRGALVLVSPDMRYSLGAGVRIEPGAAEAVAALGEKLVRRCAPLRPNVVGVRIDDLLKDTELSAPARHGGLSGSLMAVPLDQQGRILGVLLITRSRGRARFTDSDLQLLATVADQASTAISNARLYDEVQRSSEELELRVKERTYDLVMANQELARVVENLHQAQAQLVLSERLAGLGQLVAGVAHEINSPAGAIKGAADALSDSVDRMARRARELAELPLPEAARARFLSLCDDVSPELPGGLLPAPAQVRRRARELAATLLPPGLLAPGTVGTAGRTPGSASSSPGLLSPPLPSVADSPAESEIATAIIHEIYDACRALVELGVPESVDQQILQVLAQVAGETNPTPALPASHDNQRSENKRSELRVMAHALSVLVGYLEQRAYLYRNTHAIRMAIGQITRIVGALKSYSHLDQARLEPADIHEGLETTLIILHSELKYGIILTRKYGTVPAIHAYVDELNQVWTNLLHNAVQALNQQQDRSGPKEIVIETGYTQPSTTERPAEAALGVVMTPEGALLLCPTWTGADVGDRGAAGAGEVWVSITDNGPGIPLEILPRIFDPFFTTKAKGEGTGIGLGIVRQIVSKHHGRIEVLTAPGRTRFTVRLPVRGPDAGKS